MQQNYFCCFSKCNINYNEDLRDKSKQYYKFDNDIYLNSPYSPLKNQKKLKMNQDNSFAKGKKIMLSGDMNMSATISNYTQNINSTFSTFGK